MKKEKYKGLLQRINTKLGILKCVIYALLLIAQVWYIVLTVLRLQTRSPWVLTITPYVAVAVSLYIYSRQSNSSFRIMWILLISAFPILGVCLYLLAGRQSATKRIGERFNESEEKNLEYLPEDRAALEKFQAENKDHYGQAYYLSHYARAPLYDDSRVIYINDALLGYKQQVEDAGNAKRFIFLEYLQIENDECFAELKSVLIQKASEGVCIRIIYDDIGSIAFLNKRFMLDMKKYGIECRVFNPLAPVFKVFMNNRDHRKIMVVDGNIGYSGGYNITREYFHLTEPFGHWKDTAVRITGEAVDSLTAFFLSMWDTIGAEEVNPSWFFLPVHSKDSSIQNMYIQPYADDPLDDERVGFEVYMNILRGAKEYVYFSTPYLVITDEFKEELVSAKKRGVDVRIIIPGIPDKRLIYHVTRSYARELVLAGVSVYRYNIGFNHAKMCLCDDFVTVVSSVNLDYRSLYHHFENGTVIYDGMFAKTVSDDFDDMFSASSYITKDDLRKTGLIESALEAFWRLFAPLL